ncbi:MAG TPA: hypothetical protein VFH58_13715 [Acidimicrobiales bacterium]|nr:hypothetical protein [Acidimicrobiales bacterium]
MGFTTLGFGLISLIGPLAVLAVIVSLVLVAMRARRDGRPDTLGYLLHGLSLLFIVVGVISTGVAVHSVAQAVNRPGDNIAPAVVSGGFPFAPCSTSGSSSSSPTITAPAYPCVDLGPSGQGGYQTTSPLMTSGVGPFSANFSTNDSNSYISAAVASGLVGAAAVAGFLLVWPRARRHTAVTDMSSRDGLPLNYAYLLVGLSAAALLAVVPLAAYDVFRAIAPGISQSSGRGDGVRGVITFVFVGGLIGYILAYHLRYADDLRRPPSALE